MRVFIAAMLLGWNASVSTLADRAATHGNCDGFDNANAIVPAVSTLMLSAAQHRR
jgi:hypothetical protein